MLLHFLIGASVCFIGTLPFGPVNLTVVRTTLLRNHRQALEVAVAAAAVETLQVLIAAWFGVAVSSFLESNTFFRAAVATLFMLVGVFLFQRTSLPGKQIGTRRAGADLRTGLLVAALNPQAVPFWILALALLDGYRPLSLSGVPLGFFLAGVFAGKLLALGGFIAVSNYLKTHLETSAHLVNRVVGSVLVLLGLVQWLQIATG